MTIKAINSPTTTARWHDYSNSEPYPTVFTAIAESLHFM